MKKIIYFFKLFFHEIKNLSCINIYIILIILYYFQYRKIREILKTCQNKAYLRDLADTPPSAIAFHIFAWLPIASNPINATGGTGEASNSGGNDDSMFITIFFILEL